MRRLWLALALCVGTPAPAPAEDPGGELRDLFALFAEERMVVTPSKYLQPANQSPSTVTVITHDEIRLSGATTVPDVLRRVAGMEVMQTTSAEYNVSVRGNNQLLANKLLVLIDGRAFQEEIQNTVIWTALPIGLEEIERIEIVRGPGSTIWGTNAFDGVVNIITKTPRAQRGTTLSAVGGQLGTRLGSVVHAGADGDLSYKVSVGYQAANAWRDRSEQALQVFRGQTRIDYDLGPDRRVSLSGGMSHLPRYDGPLFDNGLGDTTVRTGHVQLAYEGPRSWIRGYWNRDEAEIDYTIFRIPLVIALDHTSQLYALEGQHRMAIGGAHQLVGGAVSTLTDSRGNVIDRRRRRSLIGFYLQDEWTPIAPLTVVIGARYDYHSTIHHTVNPRASLLYRPTASDTLRLSVGTAYRAPTAVELYERAGGNIHLKRERITTYEAGYAARLGDRLKGEATVFSNQLSDLIDVDANPNVNRGRLTVSGYELSGDVLLFPWLTVFANYAHQHIRDRTPVSTTDKETGRRRNVNGGIRVQSTTGVTSHIVVHHVSKLQYPAALVADLGRSPDTPSYTTVDAQIRYALPGERAEVALSASNLFNDAHLEHPRGDAIGRRVLGHLDVTF